MLSPGLLLVIGSLIRRCGLMVTLLVLDKDGGDDC